MLYASKFVSYVNNNNNNRTNNKNNNDPGQKCSACSRLYVPKSSWPKLKSQLVHVTGSGDDEDDDSNEGSDDDEGDSDVGNEGCDDDDDGEDVGDNNMICENRDRNTNKYDNIGKKKYRY